MQRRHDEFEDWNCQDPFNLDDEYKPENGLTLAIWIAVTVLVVVVSVVAALRLT
jgi:hypothetical protein